MSTVFNIVLVGVGGQGIILASAIISETALLSGFDVKTNEVHGMAQRGGSVVSQIRFGNEVFSPLVPKKMAQLVVGLEKLEALRALSYCNEETTIIVNNLEIVPVSVSSGEGIYPRDIQNTIKKYVRNSYFIDAERIAREIGNRRTENVVMIGAASKFLPFEDQAFEKSIKKLVKSQFIDINLVAFYRGKEAL